MRNWESPTAAQHVHYAEAAEQPGAWLGHCGVGQIDLAVVAGNCTDSAQRKLNAVASKSEMDAKSAMSQSS